MKQYFIADTHFGHDKYHSENWERKFWKTYNNIKTDFILYILGDLSFKTSHEYLSYIFSKFKANTFCKNIVLVLGNHDEKASKYLPYCVVCDKMIITYKNKSFVLTHEPIPVIEIINLHGHLHQKDGGHRDYYKYLNENNYLIECEKFYEIEQIYKEGI